VTSRTSLLLAVAAIAAAGVSLSARILRPDESATAAASGEQLFVAKGCSSCHRGPAGSPSAPYGPIGPSLAGATTWAADRRDGMSAEEYLTESMLDPAAFISPVWTGANGPTTGMPRLTLTDDEVESLVEYLLSDPSVRSG
jgi:cytochrome c1